MDVTSALLAYDAVMLKAKEEGREPTTADKMRAMQAAIQAWEDDEKWIDVNVRKPKVHQLVLVTRRTYYVNAPSQFSVGWAVFDGYQWLSQGHTIYTPTHWMPFPSACRPKDDANG